MPSYGRLDADYASRLATCPEAEDGPVLMVNFMRYRERADYGDAAGVAPCSGREADDRYAPLDVLAAIGAEVVFFGDVEPGGEWHRVGIVRYPTRRSFIAMQARTDFQERHVHKAAGMERTIVCGTLPDVPPAPGTVPTSRVAFELTTPGAALVHPPAARLGVEGTILGDGRRFAALGVSWLAPGERAPTPSAERVVAVVAAASIDHLAAALARPA